MINYSLPSSTTAVTAEPAPVHAVGTTAKDANGYEHFHHEPLDHNKDSIRLLKILPTLSDRGMIQCRLQHFELHLEGHNRKRKTKKVPVSKTNTNRAYWCLSYTWGDSRKTCPITINDRPYLVHQNLWDYLDFARQRLQNDGKLSPKSGVRPNDDLSMREPLMWIDAICINQDDIAEKNHQVQRMGKIYASAGWVLMWLGRDCASRSSSKRRPLLRQHEYWSRAWITQEVVLARHAYVCANSRLQVFAEFLKHVEDGNSEGNPELFQHGEAGTPFDLLSAHFRLKTTTGAARKNVFHALDTFGATKHCANILDRIYSLLALTFDHNIMVDYAVSPKQLFRHIITSRRNCPCFCAIFITARSLGISSTVIDEVSDLRVEIELPKYCCIQSNGEIDRKCYKCRCFLPAALYQADGSYICLQSICESMRGHVFVNTGHGLDTKDGEKAQQHLEVKGMHTLDCSAISEITGIGILSGTIPRKFPTGIWRFTSNALMEIAARENGGQGRGVVSLCKKMSFDIDIGGPAAMRKLRLCI